MAKSCQFINITVCCMDGGGEQVRKFTLHTAEGGGESKYVKLFYILAPPIRIQHKKYRIIQNTDIRT